MKVIKIERLKAVIKDYCTTESGKTSATISFSSVAGQSVEIGIDYSSIATRRFNKPVPREWLDDMGRICINRPIDLVKLYFEDGRTRYALDEYSSQFIAVKNAYSGNESGDNENRKYIFNNLVLSENGFYNNVKTAVAFYNGNIRGRINCGYDNFGNAVGLDLKFEEEPDMEASFRNAAKQLTGSALFAGSLIFEWNTVTIEGRLKPVCHIIINQDFNDPILINGSQLFVRMGASNVELCGLDHIRYIRNPKLYQIAS